MPVQFITQPPSPVANSSGNVAAASAVATLPAAAGKTTFLEGFDVTGTGATAASIVQIAVTGLAAGTLTFNLLVPAGATTTLGNAGAPIPFRFPTPLPASGLNTTVVVTVPSLGTGNTSACVTAYGYQI